jgi:hypothetical protein
MRKLAEAGSGPLASLISKAGEAVDLQKQRNESSGTAGDAGAAGHLANATRQFETRPFVVFVSLAGLTD